MIRIHPFVGTVGPMRLGSVCRQGDHFLESDGCRGMTLEARQESGRGRNSGPSRSDFTEGFKARVWRYENFDCSSAGI